MDDFDSFIAYVTTMLCKRFVDVYKNKFLNQIQNILESNDWNCYKLFFECILFNALKIYFLN